MVKILTIEKPRETDIIEVVFPNSNEENKSSSSQTNIVRKWDMSHASTLGIVMHDLWQEIKLRSSFIPLSWRNLIAPLITISANPSGNIRIRYLENENEWKTVEMKNCTLTTICNIPRLTTESFSAPRASMNDGIVDMILIRQDSRWKLLSLFLAMESGKHIEFDNVSYIQTKRLIYYASPPNDADYQRNVSLGGEMIDGKLISKTDSWSFELICHKEVMSVLY